MRFDELHNRAADHHRIRQLRRLRYLVRSADPEANRQRQIRQRPDALYQGRNGRR